MSLRLRIAQRHSRCASARNSGLTWCSASSSSASARLTAGSSLICLMSSLLGPLLLAGVDRLLPSSSSESSA
ncbi:hypothetical protein JOS77_00485 [Chromobacterium haemolyticum]|nr:hypothetical protein JOS77_00485 [Chromobacterium haemolyticum]